MIEIGIWVRKISGEEVRAVYDLVRARALIDWATDSKLVADWGFYDPY